MKSEKKYASNPKRANPEIPYAVRTQAPRPANRLLAEDCDSDWVDVEETSEARSSMQQTSERKVRGASTLCVTLASRHGQARLSERNFTTVLARAEENVDLITASAGRYSSRYNNYPAGGIGLHRLLRSA